MRKRGVLQNDAVCIYTGVFAVVQGGYDVDLVDSMRAVYRG